jgi:hypothetical protein
MMKHVKKPDTKKVMVRLAQGQKIDTFEVTTPAEEPKSKEAAPPKAGK